jgi:hypothetical protein
LRRSPADGSTFLACIFEAISKFHPARSAPHSSPCLAFYSCPGCHLRAEPVAGFRFRNLPSVFELPLPFRIFRILRDHSAQLDSRRLSLPLQNARFSFAPRDAKNNYLFRCAPRIIVPDPLRSAGLVVPRHEFRSQESPDGIFIAPRRSFVERRISAPKPACKLFLTGSGCSKRPFAPSQRLLVTEPPLRDQSF